MSRCSRVAVFFSRRGGLPVLQGMSLSPRGSLYRRMCCSVRLNTLPSLFSRRYTFGSCKRVFIFAGYHEV